MRVQTKRPENREKSNTQKGKERCCPKSINDKKTAKVSNRLMFEKTAGLGSISKDIAKHA